jgi:hypothetical protein
VAFGPDCRPTVAAPGNRRLQSQLAEIRLPQLFGPPRTLKPRQNACRISLAFEALVESGSRWLSVRAGIRQCGVHPKRFDAVLL